MTSVFCKSHRPHATRARHSVCRIISHIYLDGLCQNTYRLVCIPLHVIRCIHYFTYFVYVHRPQVSRPDGKPDQLGLAVVDEPAVTQSDATGTLVGSMFECLVGFINSLFVS